MAKSRDRLAIVACALWWISVGASPVLGDSYADEVLADGPVAYWRLGEHDLLDPIADASGRGLDGEYALYGKPGPELGLPGAIAGDPDAAVRFQAEPGFGCFGCGQGHMPIGGPLDLGLVGGALLTLEAWFKLYPSSDAVFTRSAFPRIFHYNAPGGQYAFGVVGDDSAGYPDKRSVWAAVGAGFLSDGVIKAASCDSVWRSDSEEWYHFVATIYSTAEGTEIRLFLNGEELLDLEDSDPIYWQDPQATLAGRREPDGRPVQGFPGLLDEVAVYDQVLPDERIRAHFLAGRPPPVARIAVSALEGPVPLTVEFDGGASVPPPGGTLERYHWYFADGEVDDGVRVSHTYERPGRYNATLLVESSLGTTAHTAERILALPESDDVGPWMVADIGDAPIPGSAGPDGPCIQAFAAGEDIGGAEDQCTFVHEQVIGDFVVECLLRDAYWQPTGRAGLMVRSSLEPDSPFVALTVVEDRQRLLLQWVQRDSEGSSATKSTMSQLMPPRDVLLRIERRGYLVLGAFSIDGSFFTELEPRFAPDLPETLLAGPFVSAKDASCSLGTASTGFCDLFLDLDPPPRVLFQRGDADDNGAIEITDAIATLGYLFLGSDTPHCLDAADADDNGGIEITDAVATLGYLFLGNDPPVTPFERCGVDLRQEVPELGCESYLSCP